jgi:hypothetical protein
MNIFPMMQQCLAAGQQRKLWAAAHLTPMLTALLVAKATVSQHKLAAITSAMAMVSSHQPKFSMAIMLA